MTPQESKKQFSESNGPNMGMCAWRRGGGGPMGPDPDLEEGPHKNYERGGKDSKGC